MLPFFAVIAAGSTGGLIAMNAAYQTDAAYAGYLARAEVGDLVVNPSIQTAQIDQVIRDLPGVTGVVSEDLLYASVGEFSPVDETLSSASAAVNVFGSADGRYVSIDRLAYRTGRAPVGTEEAVLSVEAAELTGLGVGDRVPLTFASIRDDVREIYFGEKPSIGIIGVEQPTVVGIAKFPNEVLPDGLYERGRIAVSGDIARRYGCTPDEPPLNATTEDVVDDVVQLRWNELGLSTRQRAVIVGGPMAVAGFTGALLATVVASLVPVGPVGAVEVLEQANRGLEGWAWWLAGAMTIAAVVSAMSVSFRVASASARIERSSNRRRRRRYRQTTPATSAGSSRPSRSTTLCCCLDSHRTCVVRRVGIERGLSEMVECRRVRLGRRDFGRDASRA